MAAVVGHGSLASAAGVVGSRCALDGRPGFGRDASQRTRNFDCLSSAIRRWWSARVTRRYAVRPAAMVARPVGAAPAVDVPVGVVAELIGGGAVVRVDDASADRICDSAEPVALHIVGDRIAAEVLVQFSRSCPWAMRLGRWDRSIGTC